MRKPLALSLAAFLLLAEPWPSFAADGDIVDSKSFSQNFSTNWKMVDAKAATTTGHWIDFRGIGGATLHVTGITTATLQVRVSNAATAPADASDELQYGTNITADGFTTITGPYRWIKVKISAWTSGTITALMLGSSTAKSGAGTGPITFTNGTILTDDAANTLALRNGAAGQALRIYNTFTDAANYERLELMWSSNQMFIQATNAGTGATRAITIRTGGASDLTLGTSNAARWRLDAANGGSLYASTDNATDIGGAGANRPRTIRAGTSVIVGADPGTALAGSIYGAGNTLTNLGTTASVGTVIYCTDCNVATAPCTSGGTGTLAVRVNSGTPAWRCL